MIVKAKHLTAIAIATASLMIPAAAQAANHDVRCLILSNLFSKAAPDARGKESAAQTRLFYLGRVSATVAPAQLAGVMAAEAKAIDTAQVGADMNKCLESVQTSAAAVETASAKVKATIGK
jgi:hypothetical protein